jgi:N-acetyl-1-D-myo-inositol-2-amino-2-deoxy-alpha-D-glucopyranoside deacetylase
MNQEKTLVFVGAHPDDESFGMGATLAKYVALGVKTYYICATRGEAGTVSAEDLEGYAGVPELRCAEMAAAAGAMGLAGVFYLDYRDSGMYGSPDNQNPGALMNIPIEEVAGKLVALFRRVKPDVVVTHDAGGGYGHPDHVAVHQAVVKAFSAAGDPARYPDAGSVFQPRKLYFGVRTHRLMRLAVRLMPLFGQNPRKFGRNKDIDFTKVVMTDYPVHAVVRLSRADLARRARAAACHASQGGGGPPMRGRGLIGLAGRYFMLKNRIFGNYDSYMRAFPPPKNGHKESDLFEGLG